MLRKTMFLVVGILLTTTIFPDQTQCVACHGADGNSTVSSIPKLAGQKPAYLVKQMLDYQLKDKGGRNNPIMSASVASLSPGDIQNLANFYGSQLPLIGAVKPEYLSRGQALYRGGDRAKGIPACIACHSPDGKGINSARFPSLSGQYPEYTIQQLKAFRDQTRANDPNRIMRAIAAKLSDADMEAVASYLYGLH